MTETTVMTSNDIRRSLTRIAHEILERNRDTDTIMLTGIVTRGIPLSIRLKNIITDLSDKTITLTSLDIRPYRDDVRTSMTGPEVKDEFPFITDGQTIILVDDVLYTGRSIRAAMDALIDRGRPVSIQLAVLVDRGHRELPIRADYVGKNIPSARHENIRVRLQETDGVDEVVVTKNVLKATSKGIAGRMVRKEK